MTAANRFTTFTYRLSCGCLATYYLPPKRGVFVVCGDCHTTVEVGARYPSLSSSCGVAGKLADQKTALRCTLPKGHQDEYHFDGPQDEYFRGKPRLRSGASGNTGKAL